MIYTVILDDVICVRLIQNQAETKSEQVRHSLRHKQEHHLLKAFSFSQSNKYVIVAIFRSLSHSVSSALTLIPSFLSYHVSQ